MLMVLILFSCHPWWKWWWCRELFPIVLVEELYHFHTEHSCTTHLPTDRPADLFGHVLPTRAFLPVPICSIFFSYRARSHFYHKLLYLHLHLHYKHFCMVCMWCIFHIYILCGIFLLKCMCEEYHIF